MKSSILAEIGDFGVKGGPYWRKAIFFFGESSAGVKSTNKESFITLPFVLYDFYEFFRLSHLELNRLISHMFEVDKGRHFLVISAFVLH